jgi:hypothetical protein
MSTGTLTTGETRWFVSNEWRWLWSRVLAARGKSRREESTGVAIV